MADNRPPKSAVPISTGLVGCIGLAIAIVLLMGTKILPAVASLICLAATAIPMVLWEVFIRKVHRSPSTGLDFAKASPADEILRRVIFKLFGLAVTWALIGCFYWVFKTYEAERYESYLGIISALAALLFLAAIPYFIFIDRYSADPYDGYWHTGQLFLGMFENVRKDIVWDHFLGWTIKAFFLAFMVSIVPSSVMRVLHPGEFDLSTNLPLLIMWCVNLLFLFDVCFGAIGYMFTFRILDTHIRSANPYFAGWTAALICYPPFILMGNGGPLSYRDGSDWTTWLGGGDLVIWGWGGALILLTAFYAWATVIFGLRFSNLTHRGIITSGPYRVLKHPAYWSKNIYWWLLHMPFLSTMGAEFALKNSALLLLVNGVYVLRAKTEEKHLLQDPVYREYSEWMASNGPFRWANPKRLIAAFTSGHG